MRGILERARKAVCETTAARFPGTDDTGSRFTRIAGDVDTAPFLSELAAEPETWFADTSRQRKIRCQRDTLNIFLRVAVKPLPPRASNANDVHPSRTARAAARFPHALKFCRRIAALQKGELGRATLVSLQPHGWVRSTPGSTIVSAIASTSC